MEKYGELRREVDSVQLLDAHAHSIVALDSRVPFLSCFSEATANAPHSLTFKRSLRDIAQLYGTEPSLDGIQEYRNCSGLDTISKMCFKAAGIFGIFIDDGFEMDKKMDVEWHRNYAPVVGRLLRIEHLAEKILNEGIRAGKLWTLDMFTEIFLRELNSVSNEVVGFKSIAAYRSGLEINTYVTTMEAEDGLFDSLRGGNPVRITNKYFIDYIFVRSLEVALHFDLPMQIHTGYGEIDFDLRMSNPLHLCNLLKDERFTNCRLVLLRACYPFSKEASHLASIYPQVYLDFGLAVPFLGMSGMISSVKELLELAPIKKIMFSTDGRAFPETFYLGAKKAREIVFTVLRDACIDGDLSIPEAVEAVTDIFAENAKQFYKLKVVRSIDIPSSIMKTKTNDSNQDTKLIRIIWVDTSGQHRCRGIPVKRFYDSVKRNGIGLSVASMGMSSMADDSSEGSNLTEVGGVRLIPDLSTKCKIPWSIQEEMVLADMHIRPGEAWEYCPREALRRVSKILKEEFNLVMNAGIESEFFLLKNVLREGNEEWVPFDSTPYGSTSSFDAAVPVLREITDNLQSLNIPVEQLHAEAGKGQFEIVTGYTACTNAADRLIYTHEVIRAVARKHGLLATFVPMYALDDIGSGAHVHISLFENGENVFIASNGSSRHGMSKVGEEFMAGVLYHLPSILAFTAPLPISYDRLQPNMWSGAYLCWGKENKEAPLRTSCPPGVQDGLVSNFEIKAIDGCSNPYLSLASIMAAGIDGLRRHLCLPEPIQQNPHGLKEVQRLPVSLLEAVDALEKDSFFETMIDKKLLVAIKAVRKAEIKYYSQNKDAYKQLIHRY